MVGRGQSGVRSLELSFLFALASSFALALYLRYGSGLFTVADRPNLTSYAGVALVNITVWAFLSSRLSLPLAIVDGRDRSRWPMLFTIANIGTLIIVGAVAFFWRGVFPWRLTTVLAWATFSLAGVLLAIWVRQWSDGRPSPPADLDESVYDRADTGSTHDGTRSFDYEVAKRVFDVLAASCLLIVCAPLLAAWIAWASLSSDGPAVIRQDRIGRGGRRFKMLKLRTLPVEMLATADRDWSVPATSRVMRFLRRIGLDELPQLWNVLRGDMSLVGPRPERPYFVQRFTEELPRYPIRHQLHAGLTGWAQVHGLRGDTSIATRLEYDLHYLQRWSLGLDMRILLMTAWAIARDVFRPRGLDEGALR